MQETTTSEVTTVTSRRDDIIAEGRALSAGLTTIDDAVKYASDGRVPKQLALVRELFPLVRHDADDIFMETLNEFVLWSVMLKHAQSDGTVSADDETYAKWMDDFYQTNPVLTPTHKAMLTATLQQNGLDHLAYFYEFMPPTDLWGAILPLAVSHYFGV